jgi:hypothetical protein
MNALIPNIIIEPTIQLNDMTRIDVSNSIVSASATAGLEYTYKIEIFKEMVLEHSYTFPSDTILKDAVLDIMYTTDGVRTVTFTMSDNDTTPNTQAISKTQTVVTIVSDYLYSEDYELIQYEQDILKYIRDGRNTFIDFHRAAQTEILNYLDREGVRDVNGDKIIKTSFIDITEVKEWSKFIVLRMIFESLSNVKEDIFFIKATKYKAMENEAKNRVILLFDVDGSGTVTANETISIKHGKLLR